MNRDVRAARDELVGNVTRFQREYMSTRREVIDLRARAHRARRNPEQVEAYAELTQPLLGRLDCLRAHLRVMLEHLRVLEEQS